MSVLTSALYTRLPGAAGDASCRYDTQGLKDALPRQRSVGLYQLEQGDLAVAQGQAVPIVVCRFGQALETKAVQALQERLDTDEVDRAHGWHIERIPQRLSYPQRPVVLATVVAVGMEPNANRLLQRTVLDQRRRGPAVLQSEGIEERFESRAGLPGRSHRVDLAAPGTDPCQDLAGMMIDDQERAIRNPQSLQIA